MNEQDVQAVLDRLVPSFDDDNGDWEAVVARSSLPVELTGRTSRVRPAHAPHGSKGVVLLGAAVAVAAILVLALAAPWRGGPTVLGRAAAAISGPTSEQVLYESVVVHTRGSSGHDPGVVRFQLWLEGGPHHRFRLRVQGPSANSADVGGALGNTSGLSYDFAARVLDPVPFQFRIAQSDIDPTTFLRAAIASGQATLDGKTTIAGRSVLRVLVVSHLFGRVVATTRYFVDSRTYEPVRATVDAVVPNASPLAFPLAGITTLAHGHFSRGKGRHVDVYDFTAFRLLPPTADNLKLTDVQAQHPRAKVV